MTTLQHEIKDAGYIITLNRPIEGVRLLIPMIRDTPPDPHSRGGGPRELQVIGTDTRDQNLRHHGYFRLYNPGAHLLLSGDAISAAEDARFIKSTHCTRTVFINGKIEGHLKEEEVQFHKLTAVMTMRPVALAAACDALQLKRVFSNESSHGIFPTAQNPKTWPAFEAVRSSLKEIEEFKVGYVPRQDYRPTEYLFEGYLAVRRDSAGHDSYIQSAARDAYYVQNRKRIEEEEAAARSHKNQPPYYPVSDLGRAFHFDNAQDALLAIAHFKAAAPGDMFFAAHVQYFAGQEPISQAEMKDLAVNESIKSMDPAVQGLLKRLHKNKLAL